MQFATRNCLHEDTCKQNNCNLPNESSRDLNWDVNTLAEYVYDATK